MLWETLKALFVDKTLIPRGLREWFAQRRRGSTGSR
jgi:hypothetical protein